MLSAAATTSVSRAAISEPIAVSATVQRRVVVSVIASSLVVWLICHDRLDGAAAAKSPMSFGRGGRLKRVDDRRRSDRAAPSERRLLALAQAGDERAFRELVEPHRRALEVHCYRMLGSPHDAEDVVQETLLRAWRTLDRFERPLVGRDLALPDRDQRLPRRARAPPAPAGAGRHPYPDERLEDAETPIVDPAARYALREGIELAFLTAIQRLPGRQRAILILRDVLGWTAAEVAELLESTVPRSTAACSARGRRSTPSCPASSPTAAAPLAARAARRYVDAWERADIDGLVALLREDAVLRMPPQPSVLGAAAIGDFFAAGPCGGAGRFGSSRRGPTAAPRSSCAAAGDARRTHGVLVFELDGDDRGIDAFIDPRLVELFERG